MFVGYGVEAPEQQHNDYANINVSGKIVVALFDAPKRFPSSERAHYSSGFVKRQTAVAHGAVGFFHIASPAFLKLYPWEMLSVDAAHEVYWMNQQGDPANAFPELLITGWLHGNAMSKLLGSSEAAKELFAHDAAEQPIGPTELKCALSASVSSKGRRFESSNVAAVYRGGELRDQYVVYTAHLDHLGIGQPVGDDRIYNGVLDKASGVGGLLAVANAFVSLPERTRRSVFLVAVTAEELGMAGSDYYARNPTVPRQSMIANRQYRRPPAALRFCRCRLPMVRTFDHRDRRRTRSGTTALTGHSRSNSRTGVFCPKRSLLIREARDSSCLCSRRAEGRDPNTGVRSGHRRSTRETVVGRW